MGRMLGYVQGEGEGGKVNQDLNMDRSQSHREGDTNY